MVDKRYKRNEAFRYDFGKPLGCEYRHITNVHDIETKSAPFQGEINNISPNGLQLNCSKEDAGNLKNGEQVEVTFTLSTELFVMVGEVVWEKKDVYGSLYGIKFLTLGMEKVIVDELKKYAKDQLKK
ncbi:PilZ domain-containing protein [Alkalihalobacterium chitinilyticum]|uniref:PilZ domain-containing protein n=1 Tax=Alkalihalobacterium chitinilyticum TaxID=2980103 RepID=A0ABT5VDG7_9BACI|nr:PilZ domain-containing protein [Alkalihalobacterium chitinilyticum]MDE5413498.1 PilZ domain-containing protein [Alkalihalobacterium chitinilyticum]